MPAVEYEMPAEGRADLDARALRQLTLLVSTGLVCTILIFGFMIFAATQAVTAIDAADRARETGQVTRAIAALPGTVNEITLSAMADTLDLDRARLTGADRVAPTELAVPLFEGSHDVVAWTPHLFGTATFVNVAPLRIFFGAAFVLIVAAIGIRIHILGRRLDRRRAAAAQLAMTDALTGLGNRLAFDAELEARRIAAEAGGASFALVLLDLDGFKSINDNFGHAAGDLVLKAVAGHLQGCSNRTDLVARIGGDEFAMMCSIGNIDEFLTVFRRAMEQPMLLDGKSMPVGVSIGIARSDDFPGAATRLTQAADSALYRAKRAGPGKAELAIPERLPVARFAA